MLDTLASLLYQEKRHAEAERLSARSLSIWTTLLDPDHPLVLTGIENLAAAPGCTAQVQRRGK
jgi:hypothetical protein